MPVVIQKQAGLGGDRGATQQAARSSRTSTLERHMEASLDRPPSWVPSDPEQWPICTVLDSFQHSEHVARMHPPQFSMTHHLSEWPDCFLEVRCPCSPRVIMLPVRMLLETRDRTFATVLAALRCKACGGKPAPVYIVAGHERSPTHGPPPSWAVELVPAPHPDPPVGPAQQAMLKVEEHRAVPAIRLLAQK